MKKTLFCNILLCKDQTPIVFKKKPIDFERQTQVIIEQELSKIEQELSQKKTIIQVKDYIGS